MTQSQRRIFFPLLALCVAAVSVMAFSAYARSITEEKKSVASSVIANASSVEKSVADDASQASVPTVVSAHDVGEEESAPTTSTSSSESVSAQENVSTQTIPIETSVPLINTAPSSSVEEERIVSVTLRVVPVGKSAEEYAVSISAGSSVYEVMVAAADEGFVFTSKSFPGIGRYVKSVLGIPEDKRAGFYWVYYMNGKYASQGVSDTTVVQGDVIMWKYEKK
jgi:hypothetical protein